MADVFHWFHGDSARLPGAYPEQLRAGHGVGEALFGSQAVTSYASVTLIAQACKVLTGSPNECRRTRASSEPWGLHPRYP